MGITSVLANVFSDVINSIICILFSIVLLERKKSFLKMLIAYIMGYITILIISIFLLNSVKVVLLFYHFLIFFILFKGKVMHQIFTWITTFCISYSTEVLVLAIINLESSQNFFSETLNDNQYIIFISIFKLIIFLIIFGILRSFKSYDYLKISKLSVSQTLLLTSLPLFGTFHVAVLDIGITRLEIVPVKASAIMIISSITAILYTAILLVMIDKIVLNKYLLYNVQLSKAQLDVQFEHYKSLMESTKHTKRLKHDMKNHLMCIKNLIEQDKLGEVKSFIGEINSLLNSDKNIISTGNTIVDAIVNDKAHVAQSKDINFEFSGCLPSDNFISPFDISTIFCNAIDNAIEATEKSDAPFIKIEVFSQGDCLIINISNSVNKNISIDGNTIATTKSNGSEHGFGLLNIKESVEKNKGELSLRCKNGIFTLDILFRTISLH